MRILRGLAALALVPVFHGLGCSTHAVGIDDCRSIERARCNAGQACAFGIDNQKDADECDRFARDNCLHGLPLENAPTAGKVDACVRAIDAAGACAKKSGGADSLAVDCAGISAGVTSAKASVCDVIEDPEEAVDCGFLLAEPKPAVTVDSGTGEPSTPPADSGASDGQ